MQIAMVSGWDVMHVKKCPGKHFTPTSGNLNRGWPDLFLIRGDEVVFAELKAEGKYPTPEQRAVHAKLQAAGFTVRVWRPRDRAVIEKGLR